MAIEYKATCDKCRDWINTGEEVYCLTCFCVLKKEISDLKEKINQLENEIMKKEIRDAPVNEIPEKQPEEEQERFLFPIKDEIAEDDQDPDRPF